MGKKADKRELRLKWALEREEIRLEEVRLSAKQKAERELERVSKLTDEQREQEKEARHRMYHNRAVMAGAFASRAGLPGGSTLISDATLAVAASLADAQTAVENVQQGLTRDGKVKQAPATILASSDG
jgi:hypothetical protein